MLFFIVGHYTHGDRVATFKSTGDNFIVALPRIIMIIIIALCLII
jgi:hypothetical protein